MNIKKVPKDELKSRMDRFLAAMDKECKTWEICALVDGMSMYYLTGTIADGMLLIQRDKSETLWVRRNYERAVLESEFHDIKPMASFRDVAKSMEKVPETLYLDMSSATLEWYNFLNKYIKFENVLPVDNVMLNVRSVKSEYEINLMKQAGDTVDYLFREVLPTLLHEGMSEAELGAELYATFIKNGYHGVSRFSMKNTDVVLGHIGFAESSLYPSVFNGASGFRGLCPAAPVLGSRDVLLKKGDLVYIDIGFGIEGYNVDKTMIYSFGQPQNEYVNNIHSHCLDIERAAAKMLRVGAIPSEIYSKALDMVREDLREGFMGVKGHTVKFLGHGVGLYINEMPVLAKGFDKPLERGMTIAIEPKIGIDGVGMVGSENTYLVTETGGISLTGEAQEIIVSFSAENQDSSTKKR